MPQTVLVEWQALVLECLYEETETVEVFGYVLGHFGQIYCRSINFVNVGEQIEKGCIKRHPVSDLLS